MKNNTKKIALFVAVFVAIVAVLTISIRNFTTKTSYKYVAAAQNGTSNSEEHIATNPQDAVTESVIKNANPDNKDAEISVDAITLHKVIKNDIVLGKQDAPVTMIEYASLSCPHCATFHVDGFAKLQSDYIDTGKVKFIHRDFPLNQSALSAAMIAICNNNNNGRDPVKYYEFIRALFKTQDAWAFSPNFAEKLQSIAHLDGMSVDKFNSCLADLSLQERILKSRLEAAKALQIQSTPTFIINGETVSGYSGFDEIKTIIDKKLSDK